MKEPRGLEENVMKSASRATLIALAITLIVYAAVALLDTQKHRIPAFDQVVVHVSILGTPGPDTEI